MFSQSVDLEPLVLVDLDPVLLVARVLAHAHRLEAPRVTGVQRGGVDDEDGHGRVLALGVVAERVEARLRADGTNEQVAHLHHPVRVLPGRGRAEERLVPGGAVEDLVVELAEAVRARVVGAAHPPVLGEVRGRERAHVLLDTREEGRLEVLDDLDVVLVGDLRGRDVLVQILQVQVELGTDDRAARHGRDDLDLAQEPALGHAREDAHVEKRGAEAASGEGETQLGAARRRSRL